MMNKMITASNSVFILMLVLLLLNGCVSQPYGNFIQNPSTTYSKVMADDAAGSNPDMLAAADPTADRDAIADAAAAPVGDVRAHSRRGSSTPGGFGSDPRVPHLARHRAHLGRFQSSWAARPGAKLSATRLV